jgi:hypothetical protein
VVGLRTAGVDVGEVQQAQLVSVGGVHPSNLRQRARHRGGSAMTACYLACRPVCSRP